jgi:hypothetical protein
MKRVTRSLLNAAATLALTAVFVKLQDSSIVFTNLYNSFFNSNAFASLQTTFHVDPNNAEFLTFFCYALPGLLVSIGIVYAADRSFARKRKIENTVPANPAPHGKRP